MADADAIAQRFLDLWEDEAGQQLADSWAAINRILSEWNDGRRGDTGATPGPEAAGSSLGDRIMDLDEFARRLADGASWLATLASRDPNQGEGGP